MHCTQNICVYMVEEFTEQPHTVCAETNSTAKLLLLFFQIQLELQADTK